MNDLYRYRAACCKVRDILWSEFPALRDMSPLELQQRAEEARRRGKP